jgi:cell division protein FtsB
MTLVKWVAYLLIPVLLWMVFHVSTLQAYFQTQRRLADRRAVVGRLQAEQQRLERELTALQAGGFPAEKAIREGFRMTKPDEHIIFVETPLPTPTIVEPGDKPSPPPTSSDHRAESSR